MASGLTTMERAASMILAVAFSIIGFLMMLLGVTFLPIIGILAALPVMGLALYFLNPELGVIEETKEAHEWPDAVVHVQHADCCPWPPIFDPQLQKSA